jgi:competence protein ComEA
VWALALALAVALAGASVASAAESPKLSGVVNVNTASLEELQLLPGIGETRARAILAARKERGSFKSLDELVEVKGIGETSLARLRPYLTLQGKTTARLE